MNAPEHTSDVNLQDLVEFLRRDVDKRLNLGDAGIVDFETSALNVVALRRTALTSSVTAFIVSSLTSTIAMMVRRRTRRWASPPMNGEHLRIPLGP